MSEIIHDNYDCLADAVRCHRYEKAPAQLVRPEHVVVDLVVCDHAGYVRFDYGELALLAWETGK